MFKKDGRKMNLVEKVWSVLKSNIHLAVCKLAGNRISTTSMITLISLRSTVKTSGKQSKIIIGYRSAVSPNAEISAGGILHIGDKCFINRDCIIAAHEKIEIGDNVTIGPGTYIYDHDHDGNGGYKTAPVKIEDNVWIGAGCTILKGVTIGNNSVIAAGSIITKNVPENVTVVQKRESIVIQHK